MNEEAKINVLSIILIVLTYIVPLSICHSQTTRLDSIGKIDDIRIDPASAVAGIDVMLFDSIRYVPLETNSNSEFSTISKLEVTRSFYIILDSHLNSVFFFRHDGSFSHKINKNNEGKPFKSLRSFSVDQSRRIIFVDDSMSPNINSFDLAGKFLETIKRTDVDEFQYFNSYKITYDRGDRIFGNDEERYSSIILYDAKTDRKLGKYLSVDSARRNKHLPVNPKSFYKSENDRLLFVQPYDYTIYEFDRNGIPFVGAKIIFPVQHTLPTDFLTNAVYHKKWKEYLSSNRLVIQSLRDTYFSGQWLTFYPFMNTNSGALLYNLETNDLFNLSETFDSSIGLPIAERFEGVLGIFNGALITQVSFLSLKKIFEESTTSERNNLLPNNLMKLIKRKSNNSILRLTYLKQNYSAE